MATINQDILDISVIIGKSEECKDEQDWIGTNDCWITQPHIARKTQSYNSKWKVYSVYSI